MRTLLIDGDGIAWLAGMANRDWEAIAVGMVRRLMRDLSAGRVITCWSDPSGRYFRHDLFAGYKPRRSEPPAGLPHARRGLRDEWPSRDLPGLEADDVLGILATHPGVAGELVIVSNDKDLLTVPGLHHVPRRKDGRVFEVTAAEADRAHLMQTLTGDGGDGYGGCPGVGAVRAERVLVGPPAEWWPRVVLAYQRAGLGEADALRQARVARILRADDYDLAARRVIPWVPRVMEAVHG